MPKYYDARNNISLFDLNLIEDLYTKKLNKSNIDFSNMDFFKAYLELLSLKYLIKRSERSNLPQIFYNGSKLQISNNNFLFLKFMKFHLGYLNYIEAFEKNDLKNIPVNNEMLESYIMKSFYNCLKENKQKYGSKINELNDFELVSNICAKERLTAYNFLMSMNDKSSQQVKSYLNSEYISVLRGTNNQPKFDKVYNSVKLNDFFEVYGSSDLNDNTTMI
jgi:hypothetical protein